MASVRIAEDELTFTSSRSSGPGGQNVNKTSTRVTLHFDLESSLSLTTEQKALLRRKLATRISKRGTLQVVSQKHRSQSANKRETIERFFQLIDSALEKPRPRKPTKVSRSVRKRRLQEKAHRSDIKKRRSTAVSWEE